MSLPKRDGVHDRYYLIHKTGHLPGGAGGGGCLHSGHVLDGTRPGEPLRLPDRGAEPQRDAVSPRSAAGAVSVRAAAEGLSL